MRTGSRATVLVCLVTLAFVHSLAGDTSMSPDARAFLESCRRAYANDKFDDAVKFAKKAVEMEPDASVCQLWLGVAYSEKTQSGWFGSKLMNARRCKKAFERAIYLDSSSLDAREGLIEFHVRAPGVAGGSLKTAWEQVGFIMQHDSVRGHLAAAFIYEYKDEDTSKAKTALLKAVAFDSTNVLAQLRLAGLYVRMGDRSKADSVLAETGKSGIREARLNLAWLRFMTHDASGVYRSILDNNPKDIEALFFLAEYHLGVGNFATSDSLIATLEDVTGECPELELLSVVGLPTKTYEPSDDVIESVKTYLKSEPCIQYDPCWANPHLLRGIYSHRPLRARTHYVLSGFFRQLPGKQKDFKKHAERALELDPTCWPARQALNMP
ncbi:MAG: hypothetical protein OEV49_00645 [candidate division Zixibacteria bacterium]|nr:hypothetical protein [candidate division Zixibacteria bacterium]MDH3936408.1 hypothetical protein [candidate division Zixibacteria bacterium]MDH4034224.1 hypothetical protein [candidate division Zixibacteria bacterium]